MNKKMICYILGKMLGVEGAVLLVPAFVSLLYREKSGLAFLAVSAILGILFLIFGRKAPEERTIYGNGRVRGGRDCLGLMVIVWSAAFFPCQAVYPITRTPFF